MKEELTTTSMRGKKGRGGRVISQEKKTRSGANVGQKAQAVRLLPIKKSNVSAWEGRDRSLAGV